MDQTFGNYLRNGARAVKNVHRALSNLQDRINETKNPQSKALGNVLYNKTQANGSQLLNLDSTLGIAEASGKE